jgi:hypothetical protein
MAQSCCVYCFYDTSFQLNAKTLAPLVFEHRHLTAMIFPKHNATLFPKSHTSDI